MKKSQKIILAFLGLILVVAASGLVAKKYVDQNDEIEIIRIDAKGRLLD